MVFGIGEGKMSLELGSTNIQSGKKVTGKLKLELNSPKKAKELRVELIGEQYRTTYRAGKKTRRKQVVYRSVKILGGEQEYSGGEYDFELQAPTKTELEKKASEGLAGAIMGAAKMLGAASPVEYSVVGTLDLPMSLDISKKIKIAVV